jgi:outer membrane protein TolC
VAYDRAWQDAQIQVERRFHELEEAFLSYFAASQSVRLAEEAIELASNRRDLGVITPLEFRDTASSLTQARLTLSRASFNLLTSYYALRREAGVDVADNICLLLNCCEAADV